VSVKVLPWKIFGPKRGEVEKVWKNLHSEGLLHACSSPNIVGVIKSRMVWWTDYVEHAE
jgi:hypothetical protein